MSNEKHTPGPWKISEFIEPGYGHERHFFRAVVADGTKICETHPAYDPEYEGRDIANARLIAAAPELLSELEKAHRIISNALQVMSFGQKHEWAKLNAQDGVDGEGTTRANEREAAIARAKGE